MAADARIVIAEILHAAGPVLRFDLQDLAGQQSVQVNAACDFGVDDRTVDGVAEVRMRYEWIRDRGCVEAGFRGKHHYDGSKSTATVCLPTISAEPLVPAPGRALTKVGTENGAGGHTEE